jgi:hypothetical protein
MRAPAPRRLLTAAVAVLGLTVALPLAVSGPASASAGSRAAHATGHASAAATGLRGLTTVTTAPGIAKALLGAGVAPLPVKPGTKFGVARPHPLKVSYGFPVTGGNPDLTGPSGDIFHSGGINFVSRTARLEIGRFDIDLAAGKVYATEINHAAGRIAVLDLNLSGLQVKTTAMRTVLTGITVKLDPAAAGALNATFGLALPTDGSLVFGTARVAIG